MHNKLSKVVPTKILLDRKKLSMLMAKKNHALAHVCYGGIQFPTAHDLPYFMGSVIISRHFDRVYQSARIGNLVTQHRSEQ